MQGLAVALDSAVEALTDPSAPSMVQQMQLSRAQDSAAKARAMNLVLHEEIRQLHKKAEVAQEEEARRLTINRTPPARLSEITPFPGDDCRETDNQNLIFAL